MSTYSQIDLNYSSFPQYDYSGNPIIVSSAYGSGFGSSIAVRKIDAFRTTTSLGLGSHSIDSFKISFRTAYSDGVGSNERTSWNNAGKFLDGNIVIRTIYRVGFPRREKTFFRNK